MGDLVSVQVADLELLPVRDLVPVQVAGLCVEGVRELVLGGEVPLSYLPVNIKRKVMEYKLLLHRLWMTTFDHI